MLFCTYPYFLFLLVVLVLMRATERVGSVQRILLLAASNVFYGYWDWRFLGLIWLTTVMDFAVALLTERQLTARRRKLVLAVSIVVNLALLGLFKYFDFFQDSAARMLAGFGIEYDPWLLRVTLPVGISFYVFQSMSYVIDVYRGRMKATKSLFEFAQFVMYFPQLVAGPIERAPHLMPQLAGVLRVRLPNLLSGLLLILWGCVKKALVADLLGAYLVDDIFQDPKGGLHLWIATAAFGLQIYADFSGYCDVARGSSRCLGVELVENFEAPYFAANIADFWRRWHVSLSSWFRDYLYIPLGGNRGGQLATVRNLAITMLLCGLWHGAKWTFVLWGAWHGALLLLHRLAVGDKRRAAVDIETAPNKLVFVAKVLGTFVLVTYGWMLFRINHDAQIGPYTAALFHLGPLPGAVDVERYWPQAASMGWSLLAAAAVIFAAHALQRRADRRGEQIEDLGLHPVALGACCGILAAATILFGSLGARTPFLYFQF